MFLVNKNMKSTFINFGRFEVLNMYFFGFEMYDLNNKYVIDIVVG